MKKCAGCENKQQRKAAQIFSQNSKTKTYNLALHNKKQDGQHESNIIVARNPKYGEHEVSEKVC